MVTNLPPTIAHFVQASNARDLDAFVTCFADDAVAEDEGRTHRGHGELRAWGKDTQDRYGYTIEPTGLEQRNDQTTITATLSGNFPGSPVELTFDFTIVDDLIQALKIH